MHYKNGNPAKPGDLILCDTGSFQSVGILTGASSQGGPCGGQMHVVATRSKTDLGQGPWMPAPGGTWSCQLDQCLPISADTIGTPPPGGGGPGGGGS